MKTVAITRTQPLLKVGDYILVNGLRRKITYLAKNGAFEWRWGFANINQLTTNENKKSKIIFELK